MKIEAAARLITSDTMDSVKKDIEITLKGLDDISKRIVFIQKEVKAMKADLSDDPEELEEFSDELAEYDGVITAIKKVLRTTI